MIIQRRKTRTLNLGGVLIGSDHPIAIQSMTTTSTSDIPSTLEQIKSLQEVGADIVRLAVLNQTDAQALKTLVQESPIPLVADIHYNEKLALLALDAKIPGLRLNPGNITDPHIVKDIVEHAKEYNPVIRIGVNSGSLNKSKYPEINAENMVQSAWEHIRILEELNFYNIKVSLKSSNIMTAIQAYQLFAQQSDYPIHLGITEAGDSFSSSIRSSIGLGSLLMNGIGDTIRISCSGDPTVEPKIAKEILLSLNLTQGLHIIGCPTCGRKNIDVDWLIQNIKSSYPQPIKKNITISVMGCIVNGLGEAAHADIGIVGIHKAHQIYLKGKLIKKLPPDTDEQAILYEVIQLIEQLI